MNAIVLKGVKRSLDWVTVPRPEPQAGEALVRIRAAALNRRDWWIQQGQYAGLRFPITPGSDGAGIVEAVGDQSDQAWIGREVTHDRRFSNQALAEGSLPENWRDEIAP